MDTLHRAIAGAFAGALLLSACGASGGDQVADTTEAAAESTTTSEVPETSTTEAGDDAQARAESVELTEDDFPDGWTASTPAEESIEEVLAGCSPRLGDQGTLARFQNDDFSIGSLGDADGAQFVAITEVYEDEDAAIAAAEDFGESDVYVCIDEALKDQLDVVDGATLEGSLEKEEDLDVDVDDGTGLFADYVFTFGEGDTQTISVGLAFLRTGDMSTTVAIISTGDTYDVSNLDQPIDRIAELQAAA
jgi:hypothetical protein